MRWGEPIQLSAEDLLRKPDARKDAPALSEAEQFLRELLRGGEPMPVKEVRRQVSDAGLAWRTVERAKGKAGVVPENARHENGPIKGWTWRIPQDRKIRVVLGDESS